MEFYENNRKRIKIFWGKDKVNWKLDDLEKYEQCILDSVKSNVSLINQIISYILKKKG